MFAAAFGAVIVGAVIWTLRRRHGRGSVAKPAN